MCYINAMIAADDNRALEITTEFCEKQLGNFQIPFIFPDSPDFTLVGTSLNKCRLKSQIQLKFLPT